MILKVKNTSRDILIGGDESFFTLGSVKEKKESDVV